MNRRPTGQERRGTQRRQRARHQLARIREHLAKGNVVLQVRDARAPALTDPVQLVPMPEGRRLAVVLTKADLAEAAVTDAWVRHLRDRGMIARAVAQSDPGRAAKVLRALMEEAARGVRGALGGRVVVVGLPNVGKSTLVNRLVGRRALAAGNRPGVTKGESWCRISPTLHLLDTPGVIEAMNRLLEQAGPAAYQLALLRLAPESLLDTVQVAQGVLLALGDRLEPPGGGLAAEDGPGRLEELAGRWNRLTRLGAPDLYAAAGRVLKEVGEGRWGRISLEVPPAAGEVEG